jgi:iron complex transport system ATP-binding protein
MSAGYLSLQNVSVALSGRTVLQEVSFALPRSGVVALVGPNGAGKTTLLKAISGLLPYAGTIAVGDREVSELPLRLRARQFSYLPQGHAVHWPLPVRDVVALGRFPHGATDPSRLREDDERAVTSAMVAADVSALADRRITELSGGERSRVALARVLAVEAPVILADEPVASLDPRHQIDVMKLLRATADRGALIIVVTHDLGMAARFADQVLVVSQGRLVALGSPGNALTDALLSEVFRVSAFRARAGEEAVIVPWAEG